MPNSPDIRQRVIEALKTIYDPEIPVNIYDLGLVYDIKVDDTGAVTIVMTVTTPNCPVADFLPKQIKNTLHPIEGVSDVHVEITFDPPWDMSMIPEHIKLELGLY